MGSTKLEATSDWTTGLSLVPLMRACSPAEATHRVVTRRGYARYVLPNSDRARSAAIAFFSAGSRGRIGLRVVSAFAGKPGDESRCATPLLEQVLDSIGHAGAAWALANSMPGPWSKGTVLVLDRLDRPAAVIKVGNAEIASRLIENEAGWLRSLAAHACLAPTVPRLLGLWRRDSATWLAQEPLAGSASGSALKRHHLRFLALLQQELPISCGFAGSGMETEIESQLHEVGGRIGPAWRERLERSLEHIRLLLPGDLPMTAAHRDFAAWNLRSSGGEIRVFDWEEARLGCLPLCDLFHFLLAPSLLRGPLTAAQLRNAIGTAARSASPGQKPETAAAQCLGYLLALGLKYMHGRGGVTTEPVVRHCAAAIDVLSRIGSV
jgi:hypothetical protein